MVKVDRPRINRIPRIQSVKSVQSAADIFHRKCLRVHHARYIRSAMSRRRASMYKRAKLMIIVIVAILGLWGIPTQSQERKYITPPNQVVAIRAGRLFDAKSGTLLNNQIVLIKGDRITDVGANVQIPREARVFDLGNATVLP